MAQKLSTDVSVYFVNFATANDFTPTTYERYSNDMDDNFGAILTSVNALVDEVNSLGGSGSLVNFDLVFNGSAATPGGVRSIGLIGAHSYRSTINGDTTKIDVQAGVAIIGGNVRVEASAAVLLDVVAITPNVGTNWVAVDTNGVATLQTAADQKAIDIYTFEWDGAAVTSITRFEAVGTPISGDDLLATIMPDGDAWRELLDRPVQGATWIAKTYERPDGRIEAIERVLQGQTTDQDGHAIGPLVLNAEHIDLGLLDLERGGTNKDFSGVGDGDFIVGTGAGVLGLESGATARTSLGLGTGDTPQFARLGLGAAASATASELLLLSRAGDSELILIDTGNARVELLAGAVGRLATNSAHDLELYRGGLAAANLRIDLNAGGVDLYNDNAQAGLSVSQVGGTAAIQLGLAGGKVGAFDKTPIAKPTVSGVREAGGSFVWVNFNRSGTFTEAAATYLAAGSAVTGSAAGLGWIAPRACDVTALTGVIQVTETTPGPILINLEVNDAGPVLQATINTSGSGVYAFNLTQSKGMDAVAATDNIEVEVDPTTGAFVGSWTKAFVTVEVSFDDTVEGLTNLLTALDNLGLVNDTTTAAA